MRDETAPNDPEEELRKAQEHGRLVGLFHHQLYKAMRTGNKLERLIGGCDTNYREDVEVHERLLEAMLSIRKAFYKVDVAMRLAILPPGDPLLAAPGEATVVRIEAHPCKQCGGKNFELKNREKPLQIWVTCGDCGNRSTSAPDPIRAIENWNAENPKSEEEAPKEDEP